MGDSPNVITGISSDNIKGACDKANQECRGTFVLYTIEQCQKAFDDCLKNPNDTTPLKL